MDLVNLMYQYINRMINGKQLLERLKKIDLKKNSQAEKRKVDKLICEVENIVKTIPNEIDEIEKNRLSELDHILEFIEKGLQNEKTLDKKTKEFLTKKYQSLQEEKKRVCDGGKLYTKLFDLLTENELIQQYDENMNLKERLEFITQYISVPCPKVLTQKEFEELVELGIQEDKREALWRLAFNYHRKGIDFTSIEDYFILKRDDYYLIELISAVKEDLNMENLIKKVGVTKDKMFITNFINEGKRVFIFTEEERKQLKKDCNL